MPSDVPPPLSALDVLISHWPWLAGLLAHVVRTETSRAVMATEIKRLKEDRDADRKEVADSLREIREDVKKLLARTQ